MADLYEKLSQLKLDFSQATSCGSAFSSAVKSSDLKEGDKEKVLVLYHTTHANLNNRLLNQIHELEHRLGR